MRVQRSNCWIILLVLVTASLPAARAAAGNWEVTLAFTNGNAAPDTLWFGVDEHATSGVDPELGEVCLPPWPPLDLFEVRFQIPGCELVRDLRDTTYTQRFYDIRMQAGAGGYPLTVRWDAANLPCADLYIQDGYGGLFIPPISMFDTDSLVIGPELSFVNRLTLDVTPRACEGAAPEIATIPGTQVYLGQQFPEYDLDDYVQDPDTPDALLEWSVAPTVYLDAQIDGEHVLRVSAPTGWTGSEALALTVLDPENHSDETQVDFAVVAGGLPAWVVPLQVRNGTGEGREVAFGLHPEASDGIDPDLGEAALPPWPAPPILDARFVLPDGFTMSPVDVRRSSGDPLTFDLRWQAGAGGYPITVEWDNPLPLGQFTIQGPGGGICIPPISMHDTTAVVVPENCGISSLEIHVEAVIDTVPPIGPELLEIVGGEPSVSVDLHWSPCIEDHFAYYEILFDREDFTTQARYVWDWTEDPDLTIQSTETTTVTLPEPGDTYFVFRIRAWDAFGNPSTVSERAVLVPVGVPGPEPTPGPVRRLHVWPNPFRQRAHIWLVGGGAASSFSGSGRIAVYDVSGRLVTRLGRPIPANGNQVVWDGRDAAGTRMRAGVYFLRLEPASSEVHPDPLTKIVLVR